MKRRVAALFALTLLASLPVAAEYDPIAELRARAAKLKQEDAKAKEALAAVESKYQTLQTQRNEVASQLEKLKREQIRVRGFQLWNAFAGSMGATFDVLQKVNPGANAFVAAAGFVTDQVYSAMNTSGSIPARLNKLDEKVKSLSPRLRQLQHAYSMTPQQVADELVARKMIENTWLQRWQNTPEVIAESKSVVTGKGTFILEAMGPAIGELEEILGEMDNVLRELMQLTPNLRLDAKRIPTEIHDVERQIEMQEQIKRSVIPPLPEPATVDMNAARDYAAAASEMIQAYQSMASNQIACGEHSQRTSAAYNGAYRTYSQRTSSAYAGVYRACGSTWSETCQAAWRAYYAYSSAEYSAMRNALEGAQKQINQMMESERDGPVRSFNQDMQSLRDSTLFIQGEERTFAMSGWSGSGLGNVIWGEIHWMQNWSLPIMAPVGGLYGAGRRYAEWLKMLRDTKDHLGDVERRARNESGSAKALSGRTTRLAEQLMNKRALWECSGWFFRYAEGRSSPDNDLRWLYGFDDAFQGAVEANQEKAGEYLEMLDEALAKASVAAPVMAGEEEIIRLGRAALEARRAAMRAYDPHQLDVSGSRVRDFLSFYQISHEGLRELEKLILELADEKKLEAYARTLILGEPTYNPKALYVLDRKGIEELRKSMGRQAAAIDNARESFQNARKQAEDAYREMSARLATLRGAMQSILPEQAMLLEEDLVFKEVFERLWWDAWSSNNYFSYYDATGQSLYQLVLPDPAEFGEPTYGLIPLLEKYTPLAEKYLALVNPMIENVRSAVREAKQIEAIAKRVAGNTGWISLSREGFAAQAANVRKEVMEIYEPMQKKGKAWSGSPLELAMRSFNFAVGSLAAANSEFNMLREEAARLADLTSRIAGFLAGGGGSISSGEALASELALEIVPGGHASAHAAKHGDVATALSSLRAQEQPLAIWLSRARAEQAMKQVGGVQRFYEEFAQAYSSKNLGRLTRMMTNDWHADDADLGDLEDTLSNSFRVFDTIQFRIQGLNVQPAGDNRFEASYTATITGQINQPGLKHEETAHVTDTVVNTAEGLKIQSTRGGRLWLQ